MGKRETIAYIFLAPALVLLFVFTFLPLFVSIVMAFFRFSLLAYTPDGNLIPPQFVGFGNFIRLSKDPYFYRALCNSLTYLLIVPLLQVVSVILAVLLDQPIKGKDWFRTAIYLPVVTSVVVVGIAWKWVLRSDGLVNFILGWFGIPPVPWLTDPDIALFSVMLVTLWQGMGYYMVLYLAALQSVDKSIMEAAVLDGAGFWQQLFKVTIPLLRPTVVLCTMLSCISAVKVFGEIYVMTKGGPDNGTLTLVYYIFDRAFQEFEMGYASAIALVLACFVGMVSFLNLKLFGKEGVSTYY